MSTLQAYDDLIRSFATQMGLDAEALAQTQEIVISGMHIGLTFEGDDNIGDLVYFADLGTPPEARTNDVYKTLLQANHKWVGTRGATLGLQMDTGAVTLSGRIDVKAVTGESLGMLLDVFTDTATFWRDYVAAIPLRAEEPPPLRTEATTAFAMWV